MTYTVLEIGDDAAAGYAGKVFARWGARVIRIDSPGTTTDTPEERARDLYLHAGKDRIGLDLARAEAIDLVNRLGAKADVLITDLAPAELDRLDWQNIGGAGLKVRAAITPYGLDGPYRDWAGASSVLLAMGGQTYIMGDPDRAPLTMPGRYLHYQAGQFAYAAALAALRRRPSEPQIIDVSVLETALTLSQFTTVMWTFGERVRGRHGNDFATLHPITLYPCADGWFAVNVTPDFWDAFTIMLDRPDLAGDERFATNLARVENRAALDAIVRAQLGGKTRAEIMELGQRVCRIPTGVLATHRELLDDPHLAARDFWQTIDLDGRTLKVAGSPFRFVGEAQPPQAQPREKLSPEAVLGL